MGVALHDHLLAPVREREAGREVSLRGAVDQEPGALGAPRLGGQPLRLLERRRVDADVDAVGQRRDVERQRPLADRLQQPRVGALPALVPGHVQARRDAVGVVVQRVQIRRPPLVEAAPLHRHAVCRRRRRAAHHARVAGQTLSQRNRDQAQQDHEQHHHVHLGQLLAEPDVAEDPDRQRALRARRERRHDDLVEGQRERQQAAGDERRGDHRQRHEAERLQAVGAEVHRGLDERGGGSAQPGEHVVVDDHDAEGGVADDDREQPEFDAAEGDERVQRHAR